MRAFTTLAFVFLASLAIAGAQVDPKPRYMITVKRGETPLGHITLELYPDVAPLTVHNFDSLVKVHFYDGTAFHRVIPGFMIQGGGFYSKMDGEPKESWGYSDDSQTRVPAEFSSLKHLRGIVSMARLGNDINSATSQFFICVGNPTYLDGQYTIFGHVVEGMDVADTIVRSPRDGNDSPNEKVEMTVVQVESASVGAELPVGSSGCALAAMPSITDGAVRFQYTTTKPGRVSLALFDASGREVATLVDDVQEPGSRGMAFDGSELPVGAYTARLRSGAAVMVSRFVIVR